MKLLGLALIALGVATLPASAAHACSLAQCYDNTVFPAPGELPANMVRLVFTSGVPRSQLNSPDAGLVEPRLYRLEGTTKVSVPIEPSWAGRSAIIEPIEPLPAGTQLVLEADAPSCPISALQPLQATYVVGEAKTPPAVLGTVSVSRKRQVFQFFDYQSANGCSFYAVDAAYADLGVELSPEAQPFENLFGYRAFVDGQPVSRFTTSPFVPDFIPPGEERVFTVCKSELRSPGGLAQGTHKVHFEGTLPDGTKLSTPELSIELRCDGLAPAWPDASVPRFMADASVSAPDASVDETPDAATNDDGCSLAVRGDGSWLFALALLFGRRRRMS